MVKKGCRQDISFEDLREEIDTILKNGTEKYYRQYRMRKKSGGYRVISVPNEELKSLQRKILDRINEGYFYFVSRRAFGFVPDRCTVNAALWHNNHFVYTKSEYTPSNPLNGVIKKVGNTIFSFSSVKPICHIKYMVRLDLKDAFGSVTPSMIIDAWPGDIHVPNKDVIRIAQICTLNNSLPQGAPTSPMLLNLVLMPFDKHLHARLKTLDKKTGSLSSYTRYADDLVISSNGRMPLYSIRFVSKLANNFGFQINYKKTRYMTKGTGFFVNGINVVNATTHINISRRERNKIRAAIYQASLTTDEGIKEKMIHSIRGRIQYVASIDRVHGTNLMAYAIEKKVLPDDSVINKQTLLIRKIIDEPIKKQRAILFNNK